MRIEISSTELLQLVDDANRLQEQQLKEMNAVLDLYQKELDRSSQITYELGQLRNSLEGLAVLIQGLRAKPT